MLTKGDDFPIHQTVDPIAYSGTDRNFYDRYYFNGYSRDGTVFFACALGVYPHLNIMDGAFCVVVDGVQHNLRASRHLEMERLDTRVGPLAVEVIEPLRKLRILVAENEYGISADITFDCRAQAIEEPRFTYRHGPRTLMDYTRLTQNGSYQGWIKVHGKVIGLDQTDIWGTRDRSWGVRNIGLPDPQPPVPAVVPQFFWLWVPLNFDDGFSLYHLCADERGEAWNVSAILGTLGDGDAPRIKDCHVDLELEGGTRHLQVATIRLRGTGGETRIELTPQWKFYMSGMGYIHPEWGHGFDKGKLAIGYDRIVLQETHDSKFPLHLHIQQFVTARMILPNGGERSGCGVLEQCMLGPYKPLGLAGLDDVPGFGSSKELSR